MTTHDDTLTGGHATEHPAERLTAETITSDQLDALYDRLREAEAGAEVADDVTAETKKLLERRTSTLRERARRAEMAIARVRLIKKAPSRSPFNLQANAQDDGWDQALDAVHAALGTPERCETGNARPGHPVHELLAALKSGLPHPDPVDLIGRYYDSIHQLCCPYDHSEPRPGHAAAANRAALNDTPGSTT